MWRTKKADEGVSAVIAVILMVAITVVLAGVLYVWVMQIGGNNPRNPNLTIGLASVGKSDGYYQWSVASVQGSAKISDVSVKVMHSGAAAIVADFSSGSVVVYNNGTYDEYKISHVIIIDNNADGYLNEGDTIKVDAGFVSTGDKLEIYVSDHRATSVDIV